MSKENEGKAIEEVLVECHKCGNQDCKYPCGLAQAILAKYNLEYKG
jgi:hypothetical protein